MNWDAPLDEPARCEPPETEPSDEPPLVAFRCGRCGVAHEVPEADAATCWVCGKEATLVMAKRMEAA
jgi:hypothetical protein